MQVSRLKTIALAAASLAMAGCPSNPEPIATVQPACTDCNAISATLYTGMGTGVWSYTNQTDTPVTIPVSLYEVKNQDVTLVFTNESDRPQPMTAVPIQKSVQKSVQKSMRVPMAADRTLFSHTHDSAQDEIREFNHTGWVTLRDQIRKMQGQTPPIAANRIAALPPALGDKREWYYDEEAPREATLVRQANARDGVTVNLWIEDSELDAERVTENMLDVILNTYLLPGNTYDTLLDIGGPMWGPHQDPELIAATGQPINVVILNFDRDTQSNAAGYFYGANAFRRAPGTVAERSNEAVAVFINSTLMYPNKPEGLPIAILTLAHESVHMQNFYRRGVRLGDADYAFDGWLEEGTAVMMEDYASEILLKGYNEIRDSRLPQYLSDSLYNCGLMSMPKPDDDCDIYAVWGSWGGYLNRQYGMPLYRNLLNNTTEKSSASVLDAAIRSVRPDSGTVPELRRWAASAGSLMPNAKLPAGYGYPARADGRYSLPQIDLQKYVDKRVLPDVVASSLAPYASFPIVRRGISGTYSDTMTVPPRTTLSVVIHEGKV